LTSSTALAKTADVIGGLPGRRSSGDRFVSRQDYLFTSESVAEGHPDKVCDRISDEIVDLFYREAAKTGMDPDADPAVACETLATTNRWSSPARPRTLVNHQGQGEERPRAAPSRRSATSRTAFTGKKAKIEVLLHAQSADIAQGVDTGPKNEEGAGDQGIMFGLCLPRDAGADAGADLLRPQDPRRHHQGAQIRELGMLGPDAKSPGGPCNIATASRSA